MKTPSMVGRLAFCFGMLSLFWPWGAISQESTNCVSPPTGLVSWWRAESNAFDSTGGNHGTTPFGMNYGPGEVGQAFSFNGGWERVTIPDNATFKLDSLTIEAWIKVTGDGQLIFFRGDNRPGLDPYTLALAPGGQILFHVESLNDQVNLQAPIAWGQWVHVAATLDAATGDMKLFLNGGVAAQTNTAVRPFHDLDASFDPAVGIGNHGGTAHQFPFVGLIDEVSLYSRALTQPEVLGIYAAGKAGKCVPAPKPPFISSQPQSQTVVVGSSASLDVVATGTPPLVYQWRKDGGAISGATNSIYTISAAQAADAGSYSVLVSNSVGWVVSSNAVLLVVPGGPECVQVPAGVVSWWKAENSAADLVSTNSGALVGVVGYAAGIVGQGFSFDGSRSFVQIADSPSLNITNELSCELWYKDTGCRTGNVYGLMAKRAAYPAGCNFGMNLDLTVSPPAVQVFLRDTAFASYQVSRAPMPAAGLFHHLAATYRQTTPEQIELKTYADGQLVQTAVVPGNMSRTLSSAPVVIGAQNTFEAFFVGIIDEPTIYRRALSGAEILAIYNAGGAGKCPPAPPVITVQPQSQTVVVGSSASLDVVATGTPPLVYQWRKDGGAISGATNSVYTISAAQAADAGSYSVLVSNSVGWVVSSNAVLLVVPGGPECVQVPAGVVSWWKGENSTADVVGLNPGVLVGSVNYAPGVVGQGFNFDGSRSFVQIADSPSLNLTNELTCELWYKDTGCQTGNVYGLMAKRAAYPAGCNFGINLDMTISPPALQVFLRDTASPSYQVSRAPMPAGGLFHHLAATYRQTTADQIELKTFVDGRLVQTTTVPGNLGRALSSAPVVIGAQNTFEAFFVGIIDEPTVYRRALSDAEVLAIYNAGSAGKCSTALPPFIALQPENQTVTAGQDVTFTVLAGGTPPLSYQWYLNNQPVAGGTAPLLTLTNVRPIQAGPYTVVVKNDFGAVTSAVAILTLSTSSCVPVPAGAIGWWRAQNDAQDLVSSHNGTLLNGAAFAAGKVGTAFAFDGVNQSVQVMNAPDLNPRTVSIEAWVYPYAFSVNDSVALVAKENVYGIRQYHLGLGRVNGVWHCRCAVGVPGGFFILDGGTPLQPDRWYHMAVTYDGSALRVYVNGREDGSKAVSGAILSSAEPLRMGGEATGPWFFPGRIDEVGLYNRGLSASEIAAIFTADAAGKCITHAFPPVIVSQPQDRTVTAGQDVTFTVAAGGTPPLSYQWNYKGNPIDGATSSVLVLPHVTMQQAGIYNVVVTNVVGSTTSSNATLTVTSPPALVQVANETVVGGHTVVVPVTLVANGNENALAFSLNFDPALLTYTSLTTGSGAQAAALLLNDLQAANGKVGVELGLSAGATFSPGTQEVVLVTFTAGLLTKAATAQLSFGDVPLQRQLTDALGNPLPLAYLSGTVLITPADFEGDVWPRPSGDRANNVSDWVTVGRYVAALDSPTNASEFQRADCAPRATFGDGALTIIDWVQAGRYAAKLDRPTMAAGPTGPVSNPVAASPKDGSRLLHVGTANLLPGQTGTVGIALDAQGDENALGFSLQFTAGQLSFDSAVLGSAVAGATLNINAQRSADGVVGFALALPSGTSLGAGTREVLRVTFRAAPGAAGTSMVTSTDSPILREVSSPMAVALTSGYLNGTVMIHEPPSLSIERLAQGISLSWPAWATNFVLESFGAPLAGSQVWTNVPGNLTIHTNNCTITVPMGQGATFYRLRQQ